ncbi:hypothetical protein BP6252_12485 [Coleophoma cylindrospora]|uniref:Zn(2)-C6 fungal-type domain-containing protein n=1 Tax=Coleophoma cylindrospora TaxID=1849047 RepID=A0A3D8QH04_9HELO|nr:hypothetical protein BP6252_12485 [Coleophoma cylindrospora]
MKAQAVNPAYHDPEISRPPRKRQRVPVACRPCRERKTRCTGERPFCSACVRRSLQGACDYEDGPPKPQKHINDLKDRIKELERGLNLETQSHVTGTYQHASNHRAPSHDNISGEPRSSGGRPTLPCEKHDRVDALGTVLSLDGADGFYGDSSTIAFVSQVKDAANIELPATRSADALHAENDRQPPIKSLQPALSYHDTSIFTLPPRNDADDFMYCFWEFIYPLFPVVHKPTVSALYKQLWTSKDVQDSTIGTDLDSMAFYSILNLIFALGCQFSTLVPSDQKVERANEFYEKSKALLVVNILDAMHLPLVQALLLTGIYLQSTKHANRCWNVVGLAIRVGQGLGLHIDGARPHSINQVETEMRRRIWHTCVMLDRLLAMTFGRPTTIPRTWNVERPSMIDDEYLLQDGTASQPRGLPSRLGLFCYSIELFEILDEILAAFYVHDNGKLVPLNDKKEKKAANWLTAVLTLNSSLDEFLKKLPDILRPRLESASRQEDVPHITLQANVLYGRFLYTRILLLRPVLLKRAQENIITKHQPTERIVEPQLQYEMATTACVLCVSTAHKLIAQIHENVDSLYQSSAWHSVYLTFAASTVLIAAHLCGLRNTTIDAAAFGVSEDRSMVILEHYSRQVPSAGQAKLVLRALKNRIAQSSTDCPDGKLCFAAQEDLVQPSAPGEGSVPLAPKLGNTALDNMFLQDSSQGGLEGIANISDTWFTEQFINFDWLNSPWEQSIFNF